MHLFDQLHSHCYLFYECSASMLLPNYWLTNRRPLVRRYTSSARTYTPLRSRKHESSGQVGGVSVSLECAGWLVNIT